MDELATKQLAALGRVSRQLEDAGIEYWLFGGWAVDFHVGAVTRPHDDIDLAVWLSEVPRIVELLQRDGWRHAPLADEDGGTGYERDSVRLELTYLSRGSDGHAFIPLRDARAEWPDDALVEDIRDLLGVRTRMVPLAALTRTKASSRDDPDDERKDRADYAQLRRASRT